MKKRFMILTSLLLIMTFFASLTVQAVSPNSYRVQNTKGYEITTPKENIFKLKDSSLEFILLDEFEDGYLVMTNQTVGRVNFDPDDTGKFDIEDENNIAFILNNSYLTNEEKGLTPLPDSIKSHLVEREWIVEGGHPDKGFPEDFTVNAKVVLMSATEWIKYFWNERKAGSKGCGYWYLRTQDSVNYQSDPYLSGILVATETGTLGWGKAAGGSTIRPLFVVDKEFFRKNKVVITSTGGNVLKAIRGSLTEQELIKLYNDDNVISKFEKYSLPVAKDVSYFGVTIPGRELVGTYTYYSPSDASEKGSVYRWLRSSEKDGRYAVIPGANEMTYTLTQRDVGKYIKFEVIPKTSKNVGYAARSEAWLVYPETTPVAYDLQVVGEPKNDNLLYLDYHWVDESNEPLSKVYYKWQVSTDGKAYSDILNTDTQSFVPDNTYCGKYIRAGISLEKKAGTTPVRSEYFYSEPVLIASKPTVAASSSLSSQLVGTYTYSSPTKAEEGLTEAVWEIALTPDGEYHTAVIGEQMPISKIDRDYYARFSVTPVSKDGVRGDKVICAPIKIDAAVSDAAALKNSITATNTSINTSKPVWSMGMILTIETDAEDLSFDSELFDVNFVKTKTGYTVSVTPKKTDAVFVNGQILKITSQSEKNMRLTLAKSNFFGNAEDVTNAVGFN